MGQIDSRIQGIPCIISYNYTPGVPMRVTGTGFGDCDPPEPPEIEFSVKGRRGRSANWLQDKMTQGDFERIEAEIMKVEEGGYYGY